MHPLLKSLGSKPRRGKVLRCVICSNEFYLKPSAIKIDRHTCSFDCRNKVIRKRVMLKCDACAKHFEVPASTEKWNKIRGRKKRFCSRKCKDSLVSEKSPRWIKDRSLVKCRPNGNLDHKKWREAVFKRDNYMCQDCGKRGGYLESHHIKRWADYPKLRLNVSNGMTLCKKCHDKTKGRKILIHSKIDNTTAV